MLIIRRPLNPSFLISAVLFLSFGLHAIAALPIEPNSKDQKEPGDSEKIGELVPAYFQCEDRAKRLQMAKNIAEACQHNLQIAAEAIGKAKLWKALPNDGTFRWKSASGETVHAAYLLPEDYDPSRTWPVIMCQPNSKVPPDDMVSFAKKTFKEFAADVVLVCPDRPVGGKFHVLVPSEAGDVPSFVRTLKQTIHTDDDRVYLFGEGTGGDTAWLGAIQHSQLFAAGLFVSAYPQVPYPRQTLTLLLRNLEPVPVTASWPAPTADSTDLRRSLVAANNRAIVEFARRTSLPILGHEIQAGDPTEGMPMLDRLRSTLTHRRPRLGVDASLWFRYPAQGHCGWLRCMKRLGDAWDAEQISILPSAQVDRDQFITEVIAERLAFLSGRIEGQTITVETKRCAEIELLLPVRGFDWSQPITIQCNGRRRHHGLIRPSIATMLETAYETWDFSRPVAARQTIDFRTQD